MQIDCLRNRAYYLSDNGKLPHPTSQQLGWTAVWSLTRFNRKFIPRNKHDINLVSITYVFLKQVVFFKALYVFFASGMCFASSLHMEMGKII